MVLNGCRGRFVCRFRHRKYTALRADPSIPTLVVTELGQELGGDEYERNFQRERLSLIPAEPPQRAWKARSESEVPVHYGHLECGTCCLQVFLLGLLWKGT